MPTFDPTIASPTAPETGTLSGFILPSNYTGELTQEVVKSSHPGLWGTDYSDVSPRIGFAAQLVPEPAARGAGQVMRGDDGTPSPAGQRDRRPSARVGHRPSSPIAVIGTSSADLVLLGSQPGQRQQRDDEQAHRGQEHAVDPVPGRRDPADQAADDLADPEEHRVEAHDRAAIGREALRDVGQQPERRGRGAGQDEQPAAGERARRRRRTMIGSPPAWLTSSPATTRTAPPTIPYRMIVVRRRFLKRLPQYSRPAPNTIAMTIAAIVIWLASKPRISCCSGNVGLGFENWKSDWLNQSPIEALTAIQVGARSRTCADRHELRRTGGTRRAPTPPPRARRPGPRRRAGRSGTSTP